MVQMTITLPEDVLLLLRMEPEQFAQELRMAAAVKWYEMKLISQDRAAEIAGVAQMA